MEANERQSRAGVGDWPKIGLRADEPCSMSPEETRNAIID